MFMDKMTVRPGAEGKRALPLDADASVPGCIGRISASTLSCFVLSGGSERADFVDGAAPGLASPPQARRDHATGDRRLDSRGIGMGVSAHG